MSQIEARILAYLRPFETLVYGKDFPHSEEYDTNCNNGNFGGHMAGGGIPFSSLHAPKQAQEGGMGLTNIAVDSLTLLLVKGWQQYSGMKSLRLGQSLW
jgi:hypothetical protein